MKRQYLPLITALFAATLLITNVLNNKIFVVLGLAFPAGIITFPLTFLFADALTETYGYAVTRRVIWTGFGALIFMAVAIVAAINLPPASFWPNQDAFSKVLAQVPRIVVASMAAYFAGEFCNSYVLAKAKIFSEGSHMWLRFVGSTVVGQAVDTVVFMTIAFLGVFPGSAMLTLFLSSWAFKVLWEVIALPVSLPIVRWLKIQEQEDHYDRDTKFNPFSLKVRE